MIYDNGTDNITYYTPTYPPSLYFSSTEAGTLTLSPTTCIAGSVSVESGNNTIALSHIRDGVYTCSFTVTDAGSETSNSTSVSAYNYDLKEAKASISINDNGTFGADNTTVEDLVEVPFRLTNFYDGFSGFFGYYVTDNESYTPDNTTVFKEPDNKSYGAIFSDNHTFHESNRGDNDTKLLRFFFKDNAGNISSASSRTVSVPADQTNPTFTGVTVDDVGTATDNATYTDETTVELTLSAYDNQTGLVDWFARTGDNTTPTGTETTGWNNFVNDNLTVAYTLDNGTPGNAISDNLSISQAPQTIYVWVRDGGGNIVPDNTTNVTDSIILDTIHPTLHDNVSYTTDNSTNPTNPSSTTASPYDNGSIYTDNATINLTLHFTDNETTYSNASKTYWYFITDNGSTPNPDLDNSTGGWLQLDNSTNALAQNSYDNYTQTLTYVLTGNDNRTVSVWVKDNATNISEQRSFNIVYDNASPTANAGVNLLDDYTSAINNLTVVIDNDTLFSDNITGVSRIFLTDNSSYVPSISDFNNTLRYQQGNTDNRTFTFTLDDSNSDNITAGDNLTLHAWAMDALGNISSDNISSSIIFDNSSPSNAAGELILTGINTSDNQTFYINSSTTLNTFSQTADLATDNTTLTYFVTDNSSYTPGPGNSTFSSLNSLSLSASDNLTAYVWAMDNASNVSATALDNLNVVFDNGTPTISSVLVYNATDNTTDNVTNDNNTLMVALGAADTIAVSYYYWAVDNTTAPTASSSWNSLTSGTTFLDNLTGLTYDNSSTDNGTLKIYVWVMDNASNISSVGNDNITYYYTP